MNPLTTTLLAGAVIGLICTYKVILKHRAYITQLEQEVKRLRLLIKESKRRPKKQDQEHIKEITNIRPAPKGTSWFE